ncbi:MAG: hypothetical protein ACLU90_09870 [Lachnospira sp.]
MVLAVICHYFDVNLDSPKLYDDVRDIILDSPLGDEKYNASSTNMRNLMIYLYKNNKVFEKQYESLKFKNNISSDVVEALKKN